MQSNSIDALRVAECLPILQRPSWLEVRIDEGFSLLARRMAETLVRCVVVMLSPSPPCGALICCELAPDRSLKVTFTACPRANDLEHALLLELIAMCEELHACRSQSTSPEVAAVESVPDLEFDFCESKQVEPSVGVEIFRFAQDLDQLEQRVKSRDPETNRRVAETLGRLAKSGMHRPMAIPPENWQTRFERMTRSYSNFSEVLETVVRPHVAMRALGLRHRLAPILLVGPPGIGKTRFANSLAELLGAPPALFVSIATESNGSALAGSSAFWSNSSPGQVFESIAWGSFGHPPVADGLIVLDEIDKSNSGPYSSLGALYGLLEEHTAKNYVDQSLPDLQFDASHFRVIATANELEGVPAPLQSRMLTFHIDEPSGTQVRAIRDSVLVEMTAGLGVPFSAEIPSQVAEKLDALTPRELKLTLEIALANALLAKRERLAIEDIPMLPGAGKPGGRGRRMGFIIG